MREHEHEDLLGNDPLRRPVVTRTEHFRTLCGSLFAYCLPRRVLSYAVARAWLETQKDKEWMDPHVPVSQMLEEL